MLNGQRQFETTPELLRRGFSHRDIRSQHSSGQLKRVRRGVYADDDIDDPELRHERLIRAALTAIEPTNVISHTSAGVLHGLPVPRSELGRVTITRRSPGHGRRDDNLIIRQARLDDDEVTLHEGIPVTTLVRTTTDLIRASEFDRGVMICDAAMRAGELTEAQLMQAVARHPRRAGTAKARSVIRFGDPRSESPGESLSRATMLAAGIPIPELQVEIFDENGELVGRPDFLWPELRLIGESDGLLKYTKFLKPGQTTEDAIKWQSRRDERFRQIGYWVMHWDYAIAGDKGALGTLIRRGMDHQARRHGLALPWT